MPFTNEDRHPSSALLPMAAGRIDLLFRRLAASGRSMAERHERRPDHGWMQRGSRSAG
jgi:hypothetical protein